MEPTAWHDIERHHNGVLYRSDREVRFGKVDCSFSEQNSLLYCCQEDILKCYCLRLILFNFGLKSGVFPFCRRE